MMALPVPVSVTVGRAMRAYPYELSRVGRRRRRRTYLLTGDNRASISAELASAFAGAVPLIRDEPYEGVRAISVRVRGRVEYILYVEAAA